MKDEIIKWIKDTEEELIDNYNKLGLKASGNWPTTIEDYYKQTNKGINFGIKAARYTGALVDGRKATTGGKGSPTLKEVIRKWIDDKGIVPKGKISKDSLAFLIARKIHEQGIKVPNKYNKGTLVSDVINERSLKTLHDIVRNSYLTEFKTQILGNNGNNSN